MGHRQRKSLCGNCGQVKTAFGYALARFATERKETKARWTKQLSTNVGSFYKSSIAGSGKNDLQVKMDAPIG